MWEESEGYIDAEQERGRLAALAGKRARVGADKKQWAEIQRRSRGSAMGDDGCRLDPEAEREPASRAGLHFPTAEHLGVRTAGGHGA